jgi:hypothetical protein
VCSGHVHSHEPLVRDDVLCCDQGHGADDPVAGQDGDALVTSDGVPLDVVELGGGEP